MKQTIDKNYYMELYSEWLNYRSRWRKIEPLMGLLGIVAGILFYFFGSYFVSESSSAKNAFSILFLFLGLLFFYEFYSSRTKWLKARLNSKMNMHSFSITFENDKIFSLGPFVSSNSKWDFFKEAIETKKGLFLIPQTGISIYLQKKSFEDSSQIKEIVEKINIGK